MKRNFLRIFLFLQVIILILPSQLSANFSDGTYGSGVYGGGGTNSDSGSNNAQSGSSGQSGGCTTQLPSHAPDLFQIDRVGETATLFFAPAGNPVNNYYISYGYAQTDDRFGVQIDSPGTTGAIRYQINDLSPIQGYYFRVRGGNGCSSGGWSGSIATSPLNPRSKKKVSFYPTKQNLLTTISEAGRNVRYTLTKKPPIITTQPTRKEGTTITKEKQTQTQNKSAVAPKPQTKSFLQRVLSFFGL